MSESIWRQYEKGTRFPILNRFLELCIAMKQRPEYFLGDELEALYKKTNELVPILACLPENDIEILLAAASKMKEQFQNKILNNE